MSLYVYGVMRARDGAEACAGAIPESTTLKTVEHEGLVALVSVSPDGGAGLARKAILGHSRTLQAAFAHGPVLPVRFGTVFPDEAGVERELLASRCRDLLSRLEALDGKSEMQVKARYLEEPLLHDVLAHNGGLAQTATRLKGLPPGATHFDRIALGEAIAGAVDRRRERDAHELTSRLAPLAVTFSVKEPGHEHDVVNASFLVKDTVLEAFDTEVEGLSKAHAGEMQFKLTGPMPAYSFATTDWAGAEPESRSATWA